MRDIDLETFLPKLAEALLQTLQMITLSFLVAGVLGVLLGILLYATRPGNLLENRFVFGALNTLINVIRPIPFIIIIIALIPVTRALLGTSIGTTAAVPALALVASVAIARIAESNLIAVDPGTVEAGAAMGASPARVLFTVVIPESLGPLTLGLTYIFVALVDATAVAGLVGAGGLGSLALTYGYQRFDWFVMVAVIVTLIVLVQLAQVAGNRVARAVQHPR